MSSVIRSAAPGRVSFQILFPDNGETRDQNSQHTRTRTIDDIFLRMGYACVRSRYTRCHVAANSIRT